MGLSWITNIFSIFPVFLFSLILSFFHIEHQVRKNNQESSKWSNIEIRQNCMKLAEETMLKQKLDFIRWGIAADISFFFSCFIIIIIIIIL